MSIISVLYCLLIRPLELIYEFIFSVSYKLTGSPVLSIVFLSITVGLLCLPLYTRADALQAESNEVENKLKAWKTKIKKSFKGDEQVMMLQAYYRENHYHPLMMLRSSISLLLQIPFFIAAYRMLSSSVALAGTSFGPISDLGAPDGLIRIGSFAINLLPILMTAINILSGTIYTRGMGIKPKLQLYITALVFLVLLYGSPSGLVLYWTLNNVFSLLKNVVMKLFPAHSTHSEKTIKKDRNDTITFCLYSFVLSTLIGLLIPSDILSRSAPDFMTNYRAINVPHYLWIAFFISLGFFMVWGGIYFYVMKNRKIITGIMICLTAFALLDYFAFFRNNGDLNRYFHINTYFNDSFSDMIFNLLILALTATLLVIILKNKPNIYKYLVIPAIVAITAVSAVNIKKIYEINSAYSFINNQREYPEITLSADKPNVIIIMLDRAIGRITPYIMNELPELEEQFDGFTYYNNSLSFGQHTNMAMSAVYGGYEYTPEQLNNRPDVSLMNKHNEALLMLPVLFGENDYNVTVLNPPLANYREVPDLSIFDDYPYIDAYISDEILNPLFDDMIDDWSDVFERTLFAYSFRYASPICIRELLYDDGYYNDLNLRLSNTSYFQHASDNSHAVGTNYEFLNSYYSLLNLPAITDITSDGNEGSLVIINNEITHDPTILEEPSYTVSRDIDNSDYDNNHSDRFFLNGRTLELYCPEEMGQYQIQAAAFRLLGNWFDYLRAQGVYDNTRIIIVSDHGAQYYLFGNTYDRDGNNLGILNFNCLVMVKDFGQTGFTFSNDFITNAEIPVLSCNGLIDNPTNPFTGNPIVSQLNDSINFRYFASSAHNVSDNNGNTFLPGQWFTYDPSSGDIYDQSAWGYYGEG